MAEGLFHDANDPECGCWQCAHARRIYQGGQQRQEELTRARTAAAGAFIRYLGLAKNGRAKVYSFHRYQESDSGTIDHLMNHGVDYVMEPFMLLDLVQRFQILVEAYRRGEVSFVSMWTQWDKEEAAKEAEKRSKY